MATSKASGEIRTLTRVLIVFLGLQSGHWPSHYQWELPVFRFTHRFHRGLPSSHLVLIPTIVGLIISFLSSRLFLFSYGLLFVPGIVFVRFFFQRAHRSLVTASSRFSWVSEGNISTRGWSCVFSFSILRPHFGFIFFFILIPLVWFSSQPASSQKVIFRSCGNISISGLSTPFLLTFLFHNSCHSFFTHLLSFLNFFVLRFHFLA
jgi:hypothetical protein